MKDDALGNIDMSQGKVAYIVGNHYKMLAGLPRVSTIAEFTIAVLEQRVPLYRLWVVGQGLNQEELQFLRLCEGYLPSVRFHFGSQYASMAMENSCAEAPTAAYGSVTIPSHSVEWQSFRFMDATRVQAELIVSRLSEAQFLAQDFLFTTARELSERACQVALPDGVLVIKQASFQNFHRLFPLSIMVETQFQLMHDNKRTLKSITRFYQDYTCAAEVNISFDLYTQDQAKAFYYELGEKTVAHFSHKIEEEM